MSDVQGALPGLLQLTNSAAYTDHSSAGVLTTAPAAWSTPRLDANGFGRATPHRPGVSLQGAISAIDGTSIDTTLAPDTFRTFATTELGHGSVVRQFGSGTVVRDNSAQSTHWVVDHDLSASGVRHSAFALWAYIGDYRSGYFHGRPTFWGSYAYGIPTRVADMPSAGVRTYRGLAGVQYLFPQWTYVSSFYGSVDVSFDASSLTATVSLQLDRQGYLYRQVSAGNETSYAPFDGTWPYAFATDPVSCVAPVDPATGTFQCVLPATNTEVQGRFYGPDASEVAGVARRHVPSGAGSNWGIVGGFAAARR